MGWDIVFLAEFSTPELAASRFRRVWEALRQRPEYVRLSSFKVSKNVDLCSPEAELGDFPGSDCPASAEQVSLLLGRYEQEDVAIAGTWRVEGSRNGVSTRGGVTVATYGPALRNRVGLGRAIDVSWDVGDSRRHTVEGLERHPNVEQVMGNLPVLVELGAESIWEIDAEGVISPKHLYAVFHRDPNDYHLDGIEPPFPDALIDGEIVDIATEGRSYHRVVRTPNGPIVYHEELGAGHLSVFYAGLRGVLLADAEGGD